MGPPPPPPGLGEGCHNEQINVVAGIAGAGVYWPGANFWFEDPDSPVAGIPGGVMPGGTIGAAGSGGFGPFGPQGPTDGPWPWKGTTIGREEAYVPAGQGVLWSVEPDGSTAPHGDRPATYHTRTMGDLVYLVPRPPKKR